MGQAKDFTLSTFGLLIAFFLPGLVALYGLSFWVTSIEKIFATFRTAQSNVGLFLLVLMASVIISLIITPFRALLYEELICRSGRPTASDYKKLTEEKNFDIFRSLVDETYRFHQFWGNVSFAAIPLIVHVARQYGVVLLFLPLIVEGVVIWAAIESYRRYRDRSKELLA
ncbi:hypothetical protein HRW23_18460 [Streptomyces lunaelactis]|uniref:hypothetical protein n=1 Tax=Streptomyces lunaelactis TaxID=1535768 RepID=UPI001584AA49|nr:hypothetical protein [Streptomyces lunaelactis]NUK70678.1 hypothetical protein [Streptomyces lunaelactis]NUK79344.1 hypothetical protein [Streptomyces lunaelactis]